MLEENIRATPAIDDQGNAYVGTKGGHGVLDDAEVVKTTWACGSAPAPVLARTSAVAPGAECAEGGTAVEAGSDASGDGVLQDGEVEEVAYACAAPGEPPPEILTGVGSEPIGANCYYGGSVVSSGSDLDGDGLFDAEEVSTVSYVCNSDLEFRNGFTVESEEDLALFGRAWIVKGDLIVESPTLEYLSLRPHTVLGSVIIRNCPKLRYLHLEAEYVTDVVVSGSLVVTDNALLAGVTFPWPVSPSLAGSVVHGDLVVARNPALRYPSQGFEGLAEVDGSIVFEENATLSAVILGGLNRVGGDLRIARNPSIIGQDSWITTASIGGSLVIEGAAGAPLLQLRFPYLTSVGGISVTGVESGHVFADELRYVNGSVTLRGNTWFSLGTRHLQSIDGDLSYLQNSLQGWVGSDLDELAWIGGDLVIRDNPTLTTIAMPSLLGAASVEISGNGALATVPPVGYPPQGFPRLAVLDALKVVDNPVLGHLSLPGLHALGSLTVSGNPLLPTCEAQALVAQGSPATVSVAGTDDAATCP